MRLAEIVAADTTLARRFALLCSVPGVGLVLACTLLAESPELEHGGDLAQHGVPRSGGLQGICCGLLM